MQSYIDEHQAPIDDSSTAETDVYTPTPDEEKAIKLVKKLFTKSKKHRKQYDANWADYYNMFRGKQWKEPRPKFRSSEIINLVWQTIQSFVPIMTDSRPTFEYQPQDPSDLEVTDIFNEVREWDYDRKNWGMALTEMLYDTHFYGTGLTDLDFDPHGDDGLGSIEFNTLEPFYCFPDPNAPKVNHPHSKFFIKAIPMDIDLLKCLYPTKGKYVVPDTTGMDKLPDKTNQKGMIYKTPVTDVIVTTESPDQEQLNSNKTILYTLFLKDDQYNEDKKDNVDPLTGESTTSFTQTLKYPKGRVIQMASGIILKDEELPYDDKMFPIQKCINYIDPRSFWGIGEVEQTESPQKLFNKTLSFAMDVMNLMGNPVWIVDEGCVDSDKLVNKPGLVIERERGTNVERVEGVQLQPFVMQLMSNFREWHDSVSGAQDVSRGVNPTGVTAASAIESLQNASQTRIRLKTRNLDAYLQEFGQHYLSFMLQFYTMPRVVRVTNKKDPNLVNYFKFHVESLATPEGGTQKVARIRRYNQTPDGHTIGDEQTYIINGKFDVKVATGSSLPFSKDAKEKKLFQLYDRKIIDGVEVLKGIEYPNYEAVLERMGQAANAAQQSSPNPAPTAPPQ